MPVGTIQIEVRGVKGTLKAMQNFRKLISRQEEARVLAQDIQRGARMRYSQRGFQESTGAAYEQLAATQLSKGNRQTTWGIRFGTGTVAAYAGRLENQEEVKGYHFVPMPGAGRSGEGFSQKGGTIPITKQGHFLRDAFESTRSRSRTIIERRIQHYKDVSKL